MARNLSRPTDSDQVCSAPGDFTARSSMPSVNGAVVVAVTTSTELATLDP